MKTAQCGYCGKYIRLTSDGRLKQHDKGDQYCKGSLYYPPKPTRVGEWGGD